MNQSVMMHEALSITDFLFLLLIFYLFIFLSMRENGRRCLRYPQPFKFLCYCCRFFVIAPRESDGGTFRFAVRFPQEATNVDYLCKKTGHFIYLFIYLFSGGGGVQRVSE